METPRTYGGFLQIEGRNCILSGRESSQMESWPATVKIDSTALETDKI